MQRVVRRLLSTTRTFPSTSSRELALPVAFLSAPRWSKEPSARWTTWISAFNDAGYSCLSIELDHPSGKLEDLESELVKEIRQSSSPFPPLLCAYGLNTLVAQTYVSSHPLSGLILVEPPLTVRAAAKSIPTLPLKDVEEFSYEPFFPVAILCARARAKELEQHRLRTEYPDEVNLLVSADADPLGPDGFARIKDWMDSNAL